MSENDNRKAAVKKIKLLVYNQKMNMNVYRQKIDDAYTGLLKTAEDNKVTIDGT